MFLGKATARYCQDCRRAMQRRLRDLVNVWTLLLAVIGMYLWLAGTRWQVIVLTLLVLLAWERFARRRLWRY